MTHNRKKILSLALPSMAENILQMLIGIIDNYLAAQIGLTAVSGIAIANNILTIYQALFIALGAAVSSLIARSIGEQNHSKEINYMANAILVTGALSVVLGLVSIVGYKSILAFLGAASLVARLGGQYLAIVGGMILSLGLLTSLGAIIRAKGQPSIPMKVSLLTNLLNAVFSALSLYVWGFGVIGIAWSTVASRLIGVVILCHFLPVKEIIKRFANPLDKEIFSLSLPAAGERLMMRAGDVLIVTIIVRFGTEALAGNAIGETLTQFNYMPGLAMSTATVILVANQLGSGKGATIAKTVKETFLLATLMMLVMGLITYLLGPNLLPLFTADAKAQQAGMVVLVFSLLGVPATAGTLVYTAAWQGIGQAKLPFYATTIGMWLVRISLGYFIGVTLNYGLIGVWLATILDNATRWLILAVAFKKQQRQLFSDCHS
ncbi:TPA: MATE family efflux transporter [Streptococcus equi subsp. zooepidemicus]|uniref:MATE family efflux transporter n=1 Tax=Streptococcus equi TaxID=1336 RepID=UPI0005BA20F8|nr:MATE family efflux transporter [Streptococcus equi]MCD3404042.1 MATE family efflux transporter [Streptococcus equi subsp. zooepidemicus]MCD3441103.1 MATE family efflux transporter [Streptococcus equi subsp. zooepidemicus]HEK9989713.1 MATE family efflux transporter [Streptococcus equi subsp. zooepidemicus]HEL0010043.1 MATE family efflux transporter [Streptococcus equi subsp. zooepidemicus]HEL0012117.1 MATE family efflux transporter [Streptococcus equi subsp. zooepidemicus]